MTQHQWTRRHALQAVAAASGAVALPSWSQDGKDAPHDPREIRIGQSAHTTGPLSVTMVPVFKGQELAVDEVNRKGGINGRPVRLITLDDAYDAKKCADNVRTLIDKEKVVALYGLAATANVAAALPILAEKKVPLVGIYSGSPALRVKQHPYFFTTMASYRDEVVQMVRNLVTLQKKQIGLIYQNAPFGQLMLPVVEEVVKELGATLVGKQSLEANGSDAVAAAQSLATSKPQAVLFMAYGPSMVGFVKAARSYLGVPIYAISIANSKAILAALGDEARGLAFTQTIPYPWRQTTTLTRDYNQAMERAGIPIDYDHFFGYLSLRVLFEGIRRAGKVVTPETITRGMESMTRVDLGGYPVSYGPHKHHGASFVEICIVGPGGRFMR
ncbi:MAG: ABC transporter substrate-binding protein [Rhizobacter sp.]|nr:ABC transporter substrate-binding protein [Rhizobacter sp.]